jgi:hypothetical protein
MSSNALVQFPKLLIQVVSKVIGLCDNKPAYNKQKYLLEIVKNYLVNLSSKNYLEYAKKIQRVLNSVCPNLKEQLENSIAEKNLDPILNTMDKLYEHFLPMKTNSQEKWMDELGFNSLGELRKLKDDILFDSFTPLIRSVISVLRCLHDIS